ncbi:endolytic transglycosylase MltG [Patescibacteria group bacterium]|nr:endolytic transglycosylase MltG [Patescibacteria group bacterium]
MKKFPFFVFLLIIVAVLVGVLGASWWKTNIKAPSREASIERFVIPKGYSASQIGNRLFEQGFIKNSLAFKFYVQVTGKAEKIQAGEFTLSQNFSLIEVVERLTGGPEELWITIPEGLRREEVVERVIESLELEPGKATVFRKEFLAETDGKEGFLFPDTYLFPGDIVASVVVEKLERTLDNKISEFAGAISSSGYSEKEIITLASIIERETKTDKERPVVAGILFNRLKIGMALQVDATVQYAVANVKCQMSPASPSEAGRVNVKCGDWWPTLTKQDLKIDSPYNSYKFTGLPPAPIANPGVSSIRAVIFPEDSDYLYYIHDSGGNIHYAKTLEEHNENVRRYLGK